MPSTTQDALGRLLSAEDARYLRMLASQGRQVVSTQWLSELADKIDAACARLAAPAPTSEAGRTYAPWTPEQVALLNTYQTVSGFHPFTCGSGKCSHVALVAQEDGWRCPSCDYTQDWAHNVMTRPFRSPAPPPSVAPEARHD